MIKRQLVIIFVLAAVFGFGYSLISSWLTRPREEAKIAEVSTTSGQPPITGTFIMSDTNLTSENDLKTVYDEMAATGINTVIFLASGLLQTPCNPAPPQFTETYYFTDNYPWYLNSLKQAKAHNMSVFFGLVNSDMYNCTPFWIGSENDVSTYQGRILDYSSRLVDQVKGTIQSQGWSWDDPGFAGFYFFENWLANLTDPAGADIQFYSRLAARIKTKAPGKKVLISPWVTDQYTYSMAKTAYDNLYNLGVDIIAPQDSMGSLKVTSYGKSAELFRALNDAKISRPDKEAWANIETQLQPSVSDTNYNPSTIERVSAQIDAAAPYASKMITWIYQHTMLTNPDYDSIYSWTGQFTPDRAAARRSLRTAYLAKYYGSTAQMYYYHTANSTCQITTNQYPDTISCQTNLAIYLPGQTTGICYSSLEACQAANQTAAASPSPSPSPSTAPKPGDLNLDGRVDIFDFNELITNFGSLYTIFDYNNLITNYGT